MIPALNLVLESKIETVFELPYSWEKMQDISQNYLKKQDEPTAYFQKRTLRNMIGSKNTFSDFFIELL